jgi:hypothetical protein
MNDEDYYRCCAGMDFHKKLIAASLLNGGKTEIKKCGTLTF